VRVCGIGPTGQVEQRDQEVVEQLGGLVEALRWRFSGGCIIGGGGRKTR